MFSIDGKFAGRQGRQREAAATGARPSPGRRSELEIDPVRRRARPGTISNSLRAGMVISPSPSFSAAVAATISTSRSVPVSDSLPSADLDQQVGQNRQCLATFNHADDLLQRLEQSFSLDAELHGLLSPIPAVLSLKEDLVVVVGAVDNSYNLNLLL